MSLSITTELSADYILDGTGTTLLSKRLEDWAEEIGDSKQSTFFPQFKLARWNNTCNFSMRLKLPNFVPDELDCVGNTVRFRKGNLWARFRRVPPSVKGEFGSFDFDFLLLAQPARNYLTFTVAGKGVSAEYQPFLTAAERVLAPDGYPLHERSPDVEGSYAVYSTTHRNNQYQTGKICHLFRPEAIDALGVKVWCDWSLNAGEMILTVDQTFLDTATYPVRII